MIAVEWLFAVRVLGSMRCVRRQDASPSSHIVMLNAANLLLAVDSPRPVDTIDLCGVVRAVIPQP